VTSIIVFKEYIDGKSEKLYVLFDPNFRINYINREDIGGFD
jgi:hypothetical protein